MAISAPENHNPGKAAEEDRRCVTILNKVVREDLSEEVTFESSGVT